MDPWGSVDNYGNHQFGMLGGDEPRKNRRVCAPPRPAATAARPGSPAQSCCKTGCSDTLTDSQNCGGCGLPCPPGSNCSGGTCSSTCNGGPVCTGALQCCLNGCTDTTSSVTNCGSCGFNCPAGDVCVGGACQATCNGAPACTGAETCCKTGCSDTTSDASNCGKCGVICPAGDTCVAGMCTAPMLCNGGPACSAGQTCCAGTGCANTTTDTSNCGKCGNVCPATAACVGGTCVASEGAYNPTENPSILTPGVHNFTTVNIPAGVTVQVQGGGAASGTLDLHATGLIVIDGAIDLSGGPGTQNSISSMSSQLGRAGSGGYTGEPTTSAPESAACAWVAGNPGLLGFGVQGTSGNCTVLTTCILSQTDPNAPLLFASPVAAYGGGAGVFTGYRAYGSGGGGIAGGAPGALCAAYPGEQDCSGVSGGGGAVDGQGGQAGIATYNGAAGLSGSTQCPGSQAGVPPACVGGGGGGSIGAKAAADSRGSDDLPDRLERRRRERGLSQPAGLRRYLRRRRRRRCPAALDARDHHRPRPAPRQRRHRRRRQHRQRLQRRVRSAAGRGRRRRVGRDHLPVGAHDHGGRRDAVGGRRCGRRREQERDGRRGRQRRARAHPDLGHAGDLRAERFVQPAAGGCVRAGVEVRLHVHRGLPQLKPPRPGPR